MAYLQIICVILMVAMISSSLGQKYSTRFDNIDVDGILSNKRVLTNYIKCILDEGPCTPEGREIRSNLPDAIATNCAKCSPAQVRIIRKTAPYIMNNRPQDWEKISIKFDPQRKYKDSFMKFLTEK